MIPKIIHYCWFGNAELPEKIRNCIDTWKRVLPEYEIVCWNEKNFDINISNFTKQAYETGKYAFVSDYARFYILYHFGGIYLDTDVEVLEKFDKLLQNNYFLGFEGEDNRIASCTIGSIKGHEFNKNMLDYYDIRDFIIKDNKLDMRPNTLIIEDLLKQKYGDKLNEKEVILNDIHIYPYDYFHPLNLVTNRLSITNNTYCIHWHTALWVGWKTRVIKFLRLKIFIPLFGEKNYYRIEKFRKR